MNEFIRNFTSKAKIPVTYTFDTNPFDGRVMRVIRKTEVAYRNRPSYERTSSDDGYGFVTGFLLGSAL